jgi:tRNA A37 threonylcarbamoyladenosine dehydratase
MALATTAIEAAAAPAADAAVDLERRFGALRRLYGDAPYERLRAGRVAVVGLGGVGSWAVEALARSGVARLVLIDFDHVAESNINRQVQALEATLGQAKGEALRERVAQIHPGCEVVPVDEFVTPGNWPGLLPGPVDVLIDACDQVAAKLALARWGRAVGVPVICVGAAGGRRAPARVEIADLGEVTHDPLLAALRQRLRRAERDERVEQEGRGTRVDVGMATVPHGQRRAPGAWLGVRCVFSREPVARPEAACASGASEVAEAVGASDASEAGAGSPLACHGYGSSVTVTATFGLVAAAEAIECLVRPAA